jgi:hypothetical protein
LYKAGDLEQRATVRLDRLALSEKGENHEPDRDKRRYADLLPKLGHGPVVTFPQGVASETPTPGTARSCSSLNPRIAAQTVPCISRSGLYDKRKVVAQSEEDWPIAYHPVAETRNCAMSSDQNSPTQQPEELVATRSLRTVTTPDRMTEPIAKELNECLCDIVVNASTCLRMLAATPPNVEGARETARRTIRNSNRAAEAVSRLSTLFAEKK